MNKINKTTLFDVLLLIIVFILSAIIINPMGNFPLNDDFSFIATVKNLYKTGAYIPHHITSMTLFSEAWLAYFYSLCVGFSIEKLKILVAFQSITAITFAYLTLLKLKIDRKIALLLCLTLLFNPVYLLYSFSFMTDVPFLCFIMIAIYFFVSTLTKFYLPYWFLALLFSVISVLTRQIGVSIPLAFGIAFLLKNKITNKNILFAILPFLLSLTAYFVYVKWLECNEIKPKLFNSQGTKLSMAQVSFVMQIIKNGISNLIFSLFYAALFIFPILLAYSRSVLKGYKKIQIIFSFGFSGFLFLLLYLIFNKTIPVNKNVITQQNIIGPFDDYTFYNLEQNISFSLLLSVISIYSLCLLLLFFSKFVFKNITHFVHYRKISIEIVFFSLCLIFYQVPLLVFTMYERYFFLPIVLLSILIGLTFKSQLLSFRKSKTLLFSYLVVLILCAHSIVNVKDCMVINRTRWGVINELLDKAISPKQIAGGYAFYGSYYAEFFTNYLPTQQNSHYAEELRYFIQIKPEPNMKIIKTYPFHTIYPMGNNAFYLCKKK